MPVFEKKPEVRSWSLRNIMVIFNISFYMNLKGRCMLWSMFNSYDIQLLMVEYRMMEDWHMNSLVLRV